MIGSRVVKSKRFVYQLFEPELHPERDDVHPRARPTLIRSLPKRSQRNPPIKRPDSFLLDRRISTMRRAPILWYIIGIGQGMMLSL